MSHLSEAELHGLIDGHLESDRRAGVLRRAVASPLDRKRIETWQEQADLIRAAFNGIDKEPLPSSLDLRGAPRLHCVLPIGATPAIPSPDTGARPRLVVAVVAIAMIAGAGAWLALSMSPHAQPSAAREVARSALSDDVLVRRTAFALGALISSKPTTGAVAMPTATIPDLTSVGFTFSAAEALNAAPTLLVFRYRGIGADQVVIGIRPASSNKRWAAAETTDGTLTWRAGSNAYAVAGTVAPERLHAVAASLRAASVDE